MWGGKVQIKNQREGFIGWSGRLYLVVRVITKVFFKGVLLIFAYLIRWLKQNQYIEVLLIGELSLTAEA